MTKRKLHSNLVRIWNHDKHSGNLHYEGGHFQLFGINFDVTWSSQDSSWVINSYDGISNSEASEFLSRIYDAYPDGFSDESELLFEEIASNSGNTFFDEIGEKYMVACGPDCPYGLCIQINTEGIPTGQVKIFERSDLVYI